MSLGIICYFSLSINRYTFISEIDLYKTTSVSWYDAVSFCDQNKNMLRIEEILVKDGDNYKWIGISRANTHIHSKGTSIYILFFFLSH